MTYNTLVAPKGAAGSIMNWVSYSKLDVETVVDEAQSLLFQMLRVREMRSEWIFGMAVGQSNIALPARFLDPIGRLYDLTHGVRMPHRIESDIQSARCYETLTGTLGNNPLTTTLNSNVVNVFEPAHGANQGSVLTIRGQTVFAGFSFSGSYPITSVVDVDNYTIGTGDDLATASLSGGGAGISYTIDNLISGSPSRWAIWDEQVKFDVAFDTATRFTQLYYKSPLPLSATNTSNWLTNRYPMLMRKACQAAAADFMKDDVEYKKSVEALSALIQSTAAVDDLSYRGAEFGTDTP